MQTIEIVVPELLEMRTAHVVSVGSEYMASLTPDCLDGYVFGYLKLKGNNLIVSLFVTRKSYPLFVFGTTHSSHLLLKAH